jgi:hypothetical protein
MPHVARRALHRNRFGNPIKCATTAPSDCELCSAPSTPRCCAPTAPTFDSAASGVDRASAQLGDDSEGLSDADVEKVRRQAEAMAHVIVEMLLGEQVPEE